MRTCIVELIVWMVFALSHMFMYIIAGLGVCCSFRVFLSVALSLHC